MKKLLFFVLVALYSLHGAEHVAAQSMVDVSAGASHQDAFFGNLAYRYQLNDKLRVGIETQFGRPSYRFIDAIVFKEGYVGSVAIPLTMRLYEKESLRLDMFAKAGARFQGILDPDQNDIRDSVYASTAILVDLGLLATVALSEQWNLQCGLSFPTIFQARPSFMFENLYPSIIHLSTSRPLTTNSLFFFKSAVGAALGASGDTNKFGYSLQTGIRLNLGKGTMSNLLEPSF
jgi:hypothetical protein